MMSPGAEISRARSSTGVAAPHSEAINLWKGELLSKEAIISIRETLLGLFLLLDLLYIIIYIYKTLNFFKLGRHYLLVLIYAVPHGLELIPHCILYIITLLKGL